MKKINVFLFTILLSLSGCGSNNSETPSSHVHTFSNEWTTNNLQHWHESTCGHDVKSELGDHVFSNWIIDKEPTATETGVKHRNCTICQYYEGEVIPASGEEHVHTFSTEWSYDENMHWHDSTCGHNVKSNEEYHTFSNWIIDKEASKTEAGLKHRQCSVCSYKEEEIIPKTEDEKENSIQDMTILHAWNWKLNDIKTRLKQIKKAGYGAIQTSPMQPHVDGANGAKYDTQNNWWKLYQPLGFKVATENENILGTKSDLSSLCEEAEKEGLKIIVDIVSNHLAGDGNGYNSQVYKRYPLHTYGKTNDNSIQAVVQGHIDLPDLDTSNSELQTDVLSMMKEYIDCGVSGFRFDAAKHIETPDDGEWASNYWPFILDGTTTYAISKGKEKPYYYGEILTTCGEGRSFSSYTKMMSVVDSKQGENVADAVMNNDISLISKRYNTGQSPDKLVLWSESHDTYANIGGHTREASIDKINKGYVIQASRKDAAVLYYARPNNMGVSMCTIDDLGGYRSNIIKAANSFHNKYLGKDETVYSYSGAFVNERGDDSHAGATFVAVNDGLSSLEFTVKNLPDGKYIDLISKNEFIISNKKVNVSFTDGACILIPKDDYNEDVDDDYISSLVILNAPTTYTYIAWVWGVNNPNWRMFQNDKDGIGISLNNGESYTIVEFPLGTTIETANWNIKERQTVDASFSGVQLIINYSSLNWKTS